MTVFSKQNYEDPDDGRILKAAKKQQYIMFPAPVVVAVDFGCVGRPRGRNVGGSEQQSRILRQQARQDVSKVENWKFMQRWLCPNYLYFWIPHHGGVRHDQLRK
jgi:hypothetical protein